MENTIRRSKANVLGIAGLLALLSLSLAGCGTMVGAGAGGYAGNKLTHGSTIGTVGGAVGGGVLGHVLTGN
ncbi:MAG: glycine zipper 2TM domain-containing protein [Rhodospirillaceae bacterium]